MEYDGTGFCGFQRQPEAPGALPSIQPALERKLSAVCGHQVEVTAAGRTDAGVHALGQVVHFDTTGRIPADRLARAVNSQPGEGVVVRHAEEAPEGFHARFGAVSRTYHYYAGTEVPPPMLQRYVVHEPDLGPEAVERCRKALPALLGRHDFTSFCAAAWEGKSTLRTLQRAEVEQRGALVRLVLTADAFLHTMVRIIAGTLWEIGRGKREPETLAEILAARDRTAAGATAPAHGLFLVRVEYPDGFGAIPGKWGFLIED